MSLSILLPLAATAAVAAASPVPFDRNVGCQPSEVQAALPPEIEKWMAIICTPSTQALLPQMGAGVVVWVHPSTREGVSFEAVPRFMPRRPGFLLDVVGQAGPQALGFSRIEHSAPADGSMPDSLKDMLRKDFGPGAVTPGLRYSLLKTRSVVEAFEWHLMLFADGDRLKYIYGCAMDCRITVPAEVLTGEEFKRRTTK